MSTLPDLRPDLAAIAGTIPDGSRVLDIGCGEGTLLAALAEHKGIDARGLEIDPLLRVGRSAFISFPNFAHWRMRVALGLGGRMPVTPALPESWHATGNIRNLTVVDFKELVSDRGARIERAWYFGKGREIGEFGANLRAEFALFLIGRG